MLHFTILPPLRSSILLLLSPSFFPFFQQSVPPFLRSSSAPTLRPPILPLLCFFCSFVQLLLRLSAPSSFRSYSATYLCPFVHLLLPSFLLLLFQCYVSPFFHRSVQPSLRLSMSPSFHSFAPSSDRPCNSPPLLLFVLLHDKLFSI